MTRLLKRYQRKVRKKKMNDVQESVMVVFKSGERKKVIDPAA